MELAKRFIKVFNEGPPNLDDLFKKWVDGKHNSNKSNVSTNDPKFFGVILAAFLAVWFVSGFYVVKPAEQAIVLVLGRYYKTYDQGIHWSPRIISKVFIVNTQKIMTLNHSSEMLTSDENIVDVSISVWYKISDPKKYLFNVAQPDLTIKEAAASSLRQVIGGTVLDQILTTGREKVMDDTKNQLIKVMQPYNTGLTITELNLLPAKPPEQVTPAFDDAIKAREDEQKYINQAMAYAEKVEPKAEGEAARKLQQARADAENLVLAASSDTAPFNALVGAYLNKPDLTKYRLYYSTMGKILANAHKIVSDDPNALRMIFAQNDQAKVHKEILPMVSDLDASETDTTVKSLVINKNLGRLDYSVSQRSGYE